MKKTLTFALLSTLAATGAAATDLIDTAQVISSTPIVERVSEPRQECGPSAAPAPAKERNMAGVIVGGIAGGLLGNQVGRGSGRTAATAAGAAVGAIVGDRVANPESEQRPVTGAVVGGAAGGLLGAQVGRGSGQNAAAAAGAVVGAVAGDRVQNAQSAAPAAPACRTVYSERDVVRGYTVVYRYNGRDITTTLPYQPGPTVQVNVGVVDGSPAARAPAPVTPAMMGSNVRSAGAVPPAPVPVSDVPPPAPAPVDTAGGYQYRY